MNKCYINPIEISKTKPQQKGKNKANSWCNDISFEEIIISNRAMIYMGGCRMSSNTYD